jgi:hypothetical protein
MRVPLQESLVRAVARGRGSRRGAAVLRKAARAKDTPFEGTQRDEGLCALDPEGVVGKWRTARTKRTPRTSWVKFKNPELADGGSARVVRGFARLQQIETAAAATGRLT